jgi:glycosyltransferase involved in cell wall biosynthesis
MDAYLQPSYYEGHSIAILEAMAAGLPIVSTLVGGTPELVCDGQTGFLHPPGEYVLMAGAIVDLYRRPELCSAMGGAGRERVATHFSVARMAEQYEDLNHRILGMSERPCVG